MLAQVIENDIKAPANGPFHEGERRAQIRAGVAEVALATGLRSIRDYMPEQHRDFYPLLPFMVFGGIDQEGQPWATLRANRPGFVSSPDPRTLHVDAGSLPGDPLRGSWVPGAPIGALGIQPHTKRRNRVNGIVRAVDGDTLTIGVTQSFGNCAKYINGREPTLRPSSLDDVHVEESDALSDADQALIARADVFFIASANLEPTSGFARGVDVSHRGGRPGFVRIDDAHTLTTPDFQGNKFFNTIGNLLRDPRAGLLFIDFERGDMLYIASRAEVIWEGPEIERFELAERVVRYHVTAVRRVPGALPLRWSAMQLAPQFGAPAAPASAPTWRPLRIVKIEDESPSVRSFYLESADNTALPPFIAGQYLTIRLPAVDGMKPSVRNFTLSSVEGATQPRRYRISVKKAGVASAWLHENARVGQRIDAMAPRGKFVLNPHAGTRTPVFLSAGIGITPILAMSEAFRARHPGRPIFVLQGVRGKDERPFAAHLQEIARHDPSIKLHIFDSVAVPSNPVDQGYEHAGRITIASLKTLLPFDDYDFYLCGPASFIQDLYDGLRALNIDDSRITFEAFGPSSVKRSSTRGEPGLPEPKAPAENPAEFSVVTFARSAKKVDWRPSDGSLLELAEKAGVDVPSSCRAGQCGTCSTRVSNGTTTYLGTPEADTEPGCALICIAAPSSSDLSLDL